MSICDPVLKDLICNHKNYEEIDNKQDTFGLFKFIKKTMYSNGEDDTHMGYNHVIAITIYYHVQQERYHYKSNMINLLHIKRYVSNWV